MCASVLLCRGYTIHERVECSILHCVCSLAAIWGTCMRWNGRSSLLKQSRVQREGEVHLVFFLPSFDFAVLYSQPSMQLAQPRPVGLHNAAHRPGSFRDPEVEQAISGHEPNPCEYKALKLSQALGTTGSDRCVCTHPVHAPQNSACWIRRALHRSGHDSGIVGFSTLLACGCQTRSRRCGSVEGSGGGMGVQRLPAAFV